MERKFKLYLFDLDGTLLDSDKMLVVSLIELYKQYKPKDFKPDIKKILTFSGPPIAETLKLEFPERDLDEMLEAWRLASEKNYIKYARLFKGVRRMFKKYQKEGVKFGIITSKSRKATDFSFKINKIDDLNLFSICADEVSEIKPSPEGIFKAMKEFGVENKDDVIFVGDTNFDYETARNAGVKFGFVNWSPRKLPSDYKIDVLVKSFSSFVRKY